MNRTVGAIAVAIVAIGGGAAFYGLNATDAPTVVSSPVTRGDVVQKVEATGTVQPVDSVEVGAQVTGTIKTLGATFNSEVRKGQILATLDPASLQAEVDQARANLVRLQAQYEQAQVALDDASIKLARAERLSRDQLIAQADFDVARVTRDGAQAALKSADAQVVQARASLAQSQVALQHTVITSPTDGIVLARNVEVGQTVTSGLQTPTLFVIARDLGTMQVSASVDESDIGRVAKGQPVTFTTDAYGRGRVHWHRLGGSTAAGGHAERGDLHDDHHRAEPGREAQARYDGDGGDRVGAGIRHVAGSGRSYSIQAGPRCARLVRRSGASREGGCGFWCARCGMAGGGWHAEAGARDGGDLRRHRGRRHVRCAPGGDGGGNFGEDR